MHENRPVYICDLDDTILTRNSFPQWVRFLMSGPIERMGVMRRIGLSAAACGALAKRKFRMTDHETFKFQLQGHWRTAGGDAEAVRRFNNGLVQFVRPCLGPLMTEVAAGRIDAVMATMAIADYAEDLGRMLGFRHVLAAQCGTGGVWPAGAGERKRDAVVTFLEREGWTDRPLVLLTDHLDDLPLIRLSRTLHWFGPSDQKNEILRAAPELELVVWNDGPESIGAGTIPEAVPLETTPAHAGGRLNRIATARGQ